MKTASCSILEGNNTCEKVKVKGASKEEFTRLDGAVALWQVASGELLNSVDAVNDGIFGLYAYGKSVVLTAGDTGIVQKRHATTLELQQEIKMFPRADERSLRALNGQHLIFGETCRLLSKPAVLGGKNYIVLLNAQSSANHLDLLQVLQFCGNTMIIRFRL